MGRKRILRKLTTKSSLCHSHHRHFENSIITKNQILVLPPWTMVPLISAIHFKTSGSLITKFVYSSSLTAMVSFLAFLLSKSNPFHSSKVAQLSVKSQGRPNFTFYKTQICFFQLWVIEFLSFWHDFHVLSSSRSVKSKFFTLAQKEDCYLLSAVFWWDPLTPVPHEQAGQALASYHCYRLLGVHIFKRTDILLQLDLEQHFKTENSPGT